VCDYYLTCIKVACVQRPTEEKGIQVIYAQSQSGETGTNRIVIKCRLQVTIVLRVAKRTFNNLLQFKCSCKWPQSICLCTRTQSSNAKSTNSMILGKSRTFNRTCLQPNMARCVLLYYQTRLELICEILLRR
jgi:hypothetical protein